MITRQLFFILSFIIYNQRLRLAYGFEHNETLAKNEDASEFGYSRKNYEICNDDNNLEVGICTPRGYQSNVLPSRNLTIYVALERQNIHSVNDRANSYSMHIEIALYWVDPRIQSSFSDVKDPKAYIPLSSTTLGKIWTPDIHVFNLTDYKSFKDSQHVTSANSVPHKVVNTQGGTLIEYKLEFRASVYCEFDFSNYPYDKSICKFIFGSKYTNINYIFISQKFTGTHSITGAHDCSLTMTNVSLPNSKTFKNSVGIEIKIARINRPFIYRTILPCISFVFISSLTMTLPISASHPRIGISVTVLLMTVNLYLSQMVKYYIAYHCNLMKKSNYTDLYKKHLTSYSFVHILFYVSNF